jgi:hypothetical protein
MPEEKRALAIEDCDGNRSRIEAGPEIARSHSIRQSDQFQRVIASGNGRGLSACQLRSGKDE